MWSELGDVLERQVAVASDATRRAAIYVKLGVLYTEKVQDVAQATTAWQALLAQEPDNRRAQDALKKLYLQLKDWNALEGFYAAQGKWDELVRVLERQAETEDGAGRVGLWNKIGELYRDRLQQGRPRAEGLREGAVVRREEPRRRPRRSSRSTRRQGRQAPRRGAVGPAGHTSRTPARGQRVSGDSPSCSTSRRPTRAGRCASHCRRSPRRRPTGGRIQTSRRLAQEAAGWGAIGRGLRGGVAARFG